MTSETPLATSSHRALLALGSVAALALVLTLSFGWVQYFTDRARRDKMVELTAQIPPHASLMAAQRASDTDPPAAPSLAVASGFPATLVVPSAPEPVRTLGDIGNDDALDGLPPMIRLAGPVPPDRLSEAGAMLEKFWHATEWTAKLDCVHEPARVRPLLQAYYETQRNKDPISGALSHSDQYQIGNRSVLVLSYATSQPGNEVAVILLAQPDGSFRLDWESYVGWGDMTFLDFKTRRPSSPQLMRVSARYDEAYKGEFSDPARYLCMELVSPDGLYTLHGYCDKDTPLGTSLVQIVAGGAAVKLTLRLVSESEAKAPDNARITGLIADRWLVLN